MAEETTEETTEETPEESGETTEETTEESEETTEVDTRDEQIIELTARIAQMETDHANALAALGSAKDTVISELRAELNRSITSLPNGNVDDDEEAYTEETIPTFDDLVAKATGEKVE